MRASLLPCVCFRYDPASNRTSLHCFVSKQWSQSESVQQSMNGSATSQGCWVHPIRQRVDASLSRRLFRPVLLITPDRKLLTSFQETWPSGAPSLTHHPSRSPLPHKGLLAVFSHRRCSCYYSLWGQMQQPYQNGGQHPRAWLYSKGTAVWCYSEGNIKAVNAGGARHCT